MPRPMSPEKEKEFAELSEYINFYMMNIHGVASENSVDAMKDIVQKFGKSKALIGLRQATNDTIEELSDRPSKYIEILDEALRATGRLTVSEVRRRYAASFQRILRRGAIKNETEYYLINGIVTDLSCSASDGERASLQAMLDTYEHGS